MFLFYLDESGGHGYEDKTPYFVVCALGVRPADWHTVNEAIYAAKRRYFMREDVEIKSSWLRYPRDRQKRYLAKYAISADRLSEFSTEIYRIIIKHKITLIATAVDKQKMFAQSSPEEPLLCAYSSLLVQIQQFLEEAQSEGVMIFDKISARLWKEGYEKMLSLRHLEHQRTTSESTSTTSRIIEGLLFIPSHESNFIQLADLCAYNIYRQFVEHGNSWRQGFQKRYDYFALIEPKLWVGAEGSYWGYGLRCVP